jgi:hypothetical protein
MRRLLAILLLIALFTVSIATPVAAASTGEHKTSSIVVIFDGKRLSPAEFQHVRSTHTTFVLTTEAQAEGVIYAFSSRMAAAQTLAPKPATMALSVTSYYQVFDWTNYWNDSKYFATSDSYPDLRHYSRGAWPFSLWQTWDDSIESIKNPTARAVRVYMGYNFEYSELIIPPYTNVADLDRYGNTIGLNNGVSSMDTCNYTVNNQADSCFGTR